MKKNSRKRSNGVFHNIGKIVRAPAFVILFFYMSAFTLTSIVLHGSFNSRVEQIFYQYFISSINAEQYDLQSQYALEGGESFKTNITNRIRLHSGFLYLYLAKDGASVGNLRGWPKVGITISVAPDVYLFEDPDLHYDSDDSYQEYLGKIITLNDGGQLILGRDTNSLNEIKRIIRINSDTTIILAALLAIIGGFFIAKRVLSRIDEMSTDTLAIINGDLTGRLKVTGSGDELDHLAKSINEMLSQIEELMVGLKQVSDNIAHDLKTPLTRLRNKAFDAINTAKKEDDLRDALDYIIEESDNLIKVFNSLLIIARMEAGHASENLINYNASDVVVDVSDLYEALVEDEGMDFHVEVEENLGVYGNKELLFQAISNILDNALKYGRPKEDSVKSEIEIAAYQQAGFAIIDIADNGKGIPDADKEKAFLRFSRLDASRSQPGFGLGLSLVSAVANLHGGYVKLEDNNPGLIVRLVLPLKDRKHILDTDEYFT